MVGDACGIFFRVCAVLSCSVVSNSATPWTVAHQAPLLTRILQARILQWAAISSIRGSSRPSDRAHVSYVSCICKRVYLISP